MTSCFYSSGLFLTLVMTLISISLLFATLVINIKKRGDHHPSTDVPLFLINLCRNYLARVTCTQLLTSRELYDNCAMYVWVSLVLSCDVFTALDGSSQTNRSIKLFMSVTYSEHAVQWKLRPKKRIATGKIYSKPTPIEDHSDVI